MKHSMRFTIRAAAAVLGGFVSVSPAVAAPRLVGPASQECRDTLAVAKVAFYSKAFRLSDAVTLPKGGRVAVAAQRVKDYLWNGNGINADPGVFKSFWPDVKTLARGRSADYRAFFWQIKPPGKVRWILTDERAGWRGDWYGVYALNPAILETEFTPPDDVNNPVRIMSSKMIPPLMLRDVRSGSVWAVDTENYDTSGAWTVYTSEKNGVKARCRVVFGPKARTAFALLPPALRTYARDVDATLGSGVEEGSLQPTARQRGQVAQAWTNAVLRPWAVVKENVWPYNTRRDADAGLKRWSHGAACFRVLYKRIQGEYPAAVDELAALYVARFGKTPEAARALAIHNIDVAYRDHFIFPQSFIHPAPKTRASI